jgi:uncharacterized protein YggT (Ycf19 family)
MAVIEVRWLLSVICGLIFVVCVWVSIATSVRWFQKRKTGSGLWFIGSVAAFIGVMLAPIGSPARRLLYALLPLAFEAMLFVTFMLIDRHQSGKGGNAD